MTLREAIHFYQITADDNTKKICLDIMGEYYQKNLPAHLEYIEKGLYEDKDIADYLIGFKNEMGTIESILKAQ
jgi:uncharacterized beta-barrel protein YwiB (DUF1934 family)